MTGHLVTVVRAVALYITTRKVLDLSRSPGFADTSTKNTPPESWGLMVVADRDRKDRMQGPLP